MADTTLHSHRVPAKGIRCAHCGQERRTRRLYSFYTVDDDTGARHALPGLFCSEACFDAYQFQHGEG